MSIIQGTAKGGSASFYDFPIGDSLRFDGSSYLSRTPATAGNRQTWTWSGWVKRGNLGIQQNIFGSSGATDTTFLDLRFNASDQLQVGNYSSIVLMTNQVFRDSSAWYHVAWLFDTTQTTASDRCRLFVNGTEITSFGTDVRSANFSQTTDYGINNTSSHEIGRNSSDSSKHLYGYLANIQFIDGQALDASYFGETKDDIWVPKAYTGSYGTNGFHLDFADSSNIGNDVSGNNNDWTVN